MLQADRCEMGEALKSRVRELHCVDQLRTHPRRRTGWRPARGRHAGHKSARGRHHETRRRHSRVVPRRRHPRRHIASGRPRRLRSLRERGYLQKKPNKDKTKGCSKRVPAVAWQLSRVPRDLAQAQRVQRALHLERARERHGRQPSHFQGRPAQPVSV